MLAISKSSSDLENTFITLMLQFKPKLRPQVPFKFIIINMLFKDLVRELMSVVPLGQPGMIKHLLDVYQILPSSIEMSGVVHKIAENAQGSSEISKSLSYLLG